MISLINNEVLEQDSVYPVKSYNIILLLNTHFRGQTPADAEYNFLDQVKRLDTYGVDLHRTRVSPSNMCFNLHTRQDLTSKRIIFSGFVE